MMKSAFECLLRKRNSRGILPSSSSSLIRCIAQKKNLCSSRQRETARTVPRERVECVVIGAGVVGLAVARELAFRGKQVLVLDSAPTFGTATSSRNSEVIHAGIYYPPNSLKAILCVRGREMLYKYCSEHNIPHKQIGKLIVATGASEISKLDDLMNRGIQNGVDGLRKIEASEAKRMEPELQCVKALLSPASGIVDTHSLMLSLVGEAESHRTTFSYNTTVIGAHLEGNRIYLHVSETKHLENWNVRNLLHPELVLIPELVVNSTGLSATALANRFDGLHSGVVPSGYYARGCYFTLSNTRIRPFNHLIYPIPEDGGLGVHVTLDLDGQVRFGPDVEWIEGIDDISSFLDRFDYSVCVNRSKRFYPEIRKYYPNLKDGSLEPGYAGIRPKLSGPRQSPVDFLIQAVNADCHSTMPICAQNVLAAVTCYMLYLHFLFKEAQLNSLDYSLKTGSPWFGSCRIGVSCALKNQS